MTVVINWFQQKSKLEINSASRFCHNFEKDRSPFQGPLPTLLHMLYVHMSVTPMIKQSHSHGLI